MLIIGNPLKKFLVHPSFVHEELGLGEAGGLLKVTHALVGRCELEPALTTEAGLPLCTLTRLSQPSYTR